MISPLHSADDRGAAVKVHVAQKHKPKRSSNACPGAYFLGSANYGFKVGSAHLHRDGALNQVQRYDDAPIALPAPKNAFQSREWAVLDLDMSADCQIRMWLEAYSGFKSPPHRF